MVIFFCLIAHMYTSFPSDHGYVTTCTSFFVFLSVHTCIFFRPTNAAMHNDEVVHVIYLP